MIFRHDICLKSIARLALIGAFLGVCCSGQAAESGSAVDFTRDVRPILANNCFHCHGPDSGERQADLRLDVWKDPGKIHGAQAVVTPGKPADSPLVARITSTDPDKRMPPA